MKGAQSAISNRSKSFRKSKDDLRNSSMSIFRQKKPFQSTCELSELSEEPNPNFVCGLALGKDAGELKSAERALEYIVNREINTEDEREEPADIPPEALEEILSPKEKNNSAEMLESGSQNLLKRENSEIKGVFQNKNETHKYFSEASNHDNLSSKISLNLGNLNNTNISKCMALGANAEKLLDSGSMSFLPPQKDYKKALSEWREALYYTDYACAPILKAKILSNIACLFSALNKEQHAHSIIKRAWNITISYIKSIPESESTFWINFLRKKFKIEPQRISHKDSFSYCVNVGNGGIVSALTVPSNHTTGPALVVWVLQLSLNIGNRYYKLGDIKKASKYYVLCKIISEMVIEILTNDSKFKSAGKLSSNSGKYSLDQLSPAFKPFSWLHTGQISKRNYSVKNIYNNIYQSKSPNPDLKVGYLFCQALLCNAKTFSQLGLCCSGDPASRSRALSLHLGAESRIIKLINILNTKVWNDFTRFPPYLYIEAKYASACITNNLRHAYKQEGKVVLDKVYKDMHAKIFNEYIKLLELFMSFSKNGTPEMLSGDLHSYI